MKSAKELSGDVAAKLSAVMFISDKYVLVDSPEDADVSVRISGVYLGDDRKKAMLYLPGGGTNHYTSGVQVASDAGAFTGQVLAIAAMKGAVAMNPLTGVAISLVSESIQHLNFKTEPRPFYCRIFVTFVEKGVSIGEGFAVTPDNKFIVNIVETAEGEKLKQVHELLVDQTIGQVMANLFNAEELEKLTTGETMLSAKKLAANN